LYAGLKQSGALDSGLAHKRVVSHDSLTNQVHMNGHHMNGDSLHSNRVEEDNVPDSPQSPAGMLILHVLKSTSIMVCDLRYRKLQRCMLQLGLAFELA
jgi:hypothetical protein